MSSCKTIVIRVNALRSEKRTSFPLRQGKYEQIMYVRCDIPFETAQNMKKQETKSYFASCLKSTFIWTLKDEQGLNGFLLYTPNSPLLDAGTSVSTASLSAISRDLSRMSIASSICSSMMIKGGEITSVSYQADR